MNGARRRFCLTATRAPWACSTAPEWTAASSTAWAHRGLTAPSARPAGTAGLTEALGCRYGTEPEQFRHARLIIAWGANILGTNVHLWPFIVEARRNGARFYTIDPNRNKTGRLADRHFAIYPGSDAALALGMMHIIIREKLYDADYVARYTLGFDGLSEKVEQYPPERVAALTGLGVEEIVTLAREYATTQPAAIRLNYGLQRSERGGMAVRAIALLPGAHWRMASTSAAACSSPLRRLSISIVPAWSAKICRCVRPSAGRARIVNMSELGRALNLLKGPPVKALVVYNSNPAAIAPNQNLVIRGLSRRTCSPSSSTSSKRTPRITPTSCSPSPPSWSTPTSITPTAITTCSSRVPPLRLPARPGPTSRSSGCSPKGWASMTPASAIRKTTWSAPLLDSGHPFVRGITLERLEHEHFVRLQVAPPGEPFLPFAQGGFGTQSGRCEFHAETFGYTPPVESRLGSEALRARYPLELITPKNDDSMNSTFGNRLAVDEQTSVLQLNAADASQRNIRSGDPVRVFNDRGASVLTARVDPDSIRPGVARATAVRWNKTAPDRRNVNVLTSDRLTDIGGGPVFYSCLVQVEKCGD